MSIKNCCIVTVIKFVESRNQVVLIRAIIIHASNGRELCHLYSVHLIFLYNVMS